MKNEIKEILDRFNYVKKEPNKLSYYPEDLLTREELWLLYDYITNLQDRINKTIEYIDNRCLDEYGYVGYGDDLNPRRLVNILKGEDKGE